MPADFDEVIGLLSSGKYLITLHAKKRMALRKISHADIKNCGSTGFAFQSEDKIKVCELDCDGEELSVICVYEESVLIITVF